jgi:hypothetical protein
MGALRFYESPGSATMLVASLQISISFFFYFAFFGGNIKKE